MDKIHSSWKPVFENFDILIEDSFLPQDVFKVFTIDLKDIKIVLLGQDPYYKEGQADGLSFSVKKNIKIPPSLKNIYKELNRTFPERNYNFEHGNLENWFNKGILLLNSSLTVLPGKPGSHIKKWEKFTNKVIKFISENTNAVFLLLGLFAKSKSKFIKNNIVSEVHPSPSTHGFVGSDVFKKLEIALGYPFDWNI